MAWQYAATMEERTGADIKRPPASVIEGLANVSAATAGAELCNTFGIRNSHISGGITAQASNGGKKIVGPAITLQFMPLREDIYPDNINRGPGKLPENPDGANTIQLHRAALYHTKPGDVIVVDARGDMDSGIFGEMMATYFQGAGGLGMVIDGCLRDFPVISRELDLVSTATVCPSHLTTRPSDAAPTGPLDQRGHPQLPHADQHRSLGRECPDLVRWEARHAGRYHCGR